jgi:hypothetical protein
VQSCGFGGLAVLFLAQWGLRAPLGQLGNVICAGGDMSMQVVSTHAALRASVHFAQAHVKLGQS